MNKVRITCEVIDSNNDIIESETFESRLPGPGGKKNDLYMINHEAAISALAEAQEPMMKLGAQCVSHAVWRAASVLRHHHNKMLDEQQEKESREAPDLVIVDDEDETAPEPGSVEDAEEAGPPL